MEETGETGTRQAMEEKPAAHAVKTAKKDDNTIFVGKKGTMGYVLAVVTQFNNGASDVAIKARGRLISKAVDVAEIVRHRFMPKAKVQNIDIKTEELTSEDGSINKVSAIEILLQK
ncbi:MAG TPA: DNA-binding protein Alba [Candidatus Bilamarchaeaceae archaeon]|nr:DNA-binding protein Alba [Candidatus Bilamarchaeaceae archaeon]